MSGSQLRDDARQSRKPGRPAIKGSAMTPAERKRRQRQRDREAVKSEHPELEFRDQLLQLMWRYAESHRDFQICHAANSLAKVANLLRSADSRPDLLDYVMDPSEVYGFGSLLEDVDGGVCLVEALLAWQLGRNDESEE